VKYASRLSEDELKTLYQIFVGKEANVISLDISQFDNSICLDGTIEIPDDEEETKSEMIEVEDNYEINDYNVKVYCHSGYVTKEYREFMYEKFGDEYARDYLLS
jgi:succinyl-CoA synthetase beta subunit